jgi:hypothetical protein
VVESYVWSVCWGFSFLGHVLYNICVTPNSTDFVLRQGREIMLSVEPTFQVCSVSYIEHLSINKALADDFNHIWHDPP